MRTQTAAAAAPRPVLSDSLSTIFSWIVLTAISVILTGWLWGNLLRAHRPRSAGDFDVFGIRMPGVLRIVIRGTEVKLGFVVLIVTFTVIALVGGESAYDLFVQRWGLDLGQFTSLFVFSAFSSVTLSAFLLLGVRATGSIVRPRNEVVDEHHDLIRNMENTSECPEEQDAEECDQR